MIDTGIQPNLVHDDNSSLLGLLVKLAHHRTDVAGGDNMGLPLDSSLDDRSMVGVGDEGNDDIG